LWLFFTSGHQTGGNKLFSTNQEGKVTLGEQEKDGYFEAGTGQWLNP
jgi:hypothetical protein